MVRYKNTNSGRAGTSTGNHSRLGNLSTKVFIFDHAIKETPFRHHRHKIVINPYWHVNILINVITTELYFQYMTLWVIPN